jgi:hypothetical protein
MRYDGKNMVLNAHEKKIQERGKLRFLAQLLGWGQGFPDKIARLGYLGLVR